MYQFGFKKRHSTTLGCSVLKHVIDYYRKKGSYVFVSLLDLSKAFDNVDHRLLFKKLLCLKLPKNYINLLAWWYANQLVNIKWKSVTTDSFLMKNGTRQGSILSPYLFSVYMREVSISVTSSGVGCHIGNMLCNILLYADDIVLLSPAWRAQQTLLNICCDTVAPLSMKFNVSKSVTIIFPPLKTSCRVNFSFPNFELDGHNMCFVNKCKYLGHFLSTLEDDNVDIMNQRCLLYARTNFLIRKFANCSTEVKICLFKTYCVNFYGVSLWRCYNTTVLKKFEAAYIKCNKIFFGYDRRHHVASVFIDLRLPTVSTILHNAVHKFHESVHDHINILVQYVHLVCTV